MRNFLLFLTLCALTLTASNVFAESYDESKRTERFGLSFYDGRPLYIVKFGRYAETLEYCSQLEYIRVHSGSSLDDYGSRFRDGVNVEMFRDDNGNYIEFLFFIYSVDEDGVLKPLFDESVLQGRPFYEEAIASYSPVVSPGDLAVETYDNILPNAQDWARRGILLAVALFVLSTGSNKFRELTSGEAQATVKEDKKADATSSQEERATVRKIREAAKLGKLGGGLDERFLSESERREYDFITGKAFGLEFDDKVRASNKLFLDAFNRLPRYEQEALLQEWRVSSYTESYQGSVERRFIDWREGSGNDGATSRKQTDAFDNWFGSSDPFNDNDEEDGESPF